MQILSNPISALNVRDLPKFSRALGNRGLRTRWWCQILDRKWKYGLFVMRHASGHNYRNSSFSIDLAMGQIPRSTERISTSIYVVLHSLLYKLIVSNKLI